MPVKIALRYLDGRDKVALLNQVLDVAGLEAELEAMRKSLRKERGNLKIAIKPNASMFARRDDDGVTTDAVLVLALVERLHEMGYPNIDVVESSNAYEVTFTERNHCHDGDGTQRRRSLARAGPAVHGRPRRNTQRPRIRVHPGILKQRRGWRATSDTYTLYQLGR
jgi:hypothetical protein